MTPRNNRPLGPGECRVDFDWRLCPKCGTPERPAVELRAMVVGGPSDGVSFTWALPDDVLQEFAHWLADVAIERAER